MRFSSAAVSALSAVGAATSALSSMAPTNLLDDSGTAAGALVSPVSPDWTGLPASSKYPGLTAAILSDLCSSPGAHSVVYVEETRPSGPPSSFELESGAPSQTSLQDSIRRYSGESQEVPGSYTPNGSDDDDQYDSDNVSFRTALGSSDVADLESESHQPTCRSEPSYQSASPVHSGVPDTSNLDTTPTFPPVSTALAVTYPQPTIPESTALETFDVKSTVTESTDTEARDIESSVGDCYTSPGPVTVDDTPSASTPAGFRDSSNETPEKASRWDQFTSGALSLGSRGIGAARKLGSIIERAYDRRDGGNTVSGSGGFTGVRPLLGEMSHFVGNGLSSAIAYAAETGNFLSQDSPGSSGKDSRGDLVKRSVDSVKNIAESAFAAGRRCTSRSNSQTSSDSRKGLVARGFDFKSRSSAPVSIIRSWFRRSSGKDSRRDLVKRTVVDPVTSFAKSVYAAGRRHMYTSRSDSQPPDSGKRWKSWGRERSKSRSSASVSNIRSWFGERQSPAASDVSFASRAIRSVGDKGHSAMSAGKKWFSGSKADEPEKNSGRYESIKGRIRNAYARTGSFFSKYPETTKTKKESQSSYELWRWA